MCVNVCCVFYLQFFNYVLWCMCCVRLSYWIKITYLLTYLLIDYCNSVLDIRRHEFVRNADVRCITNQPPLSSIIKSRRLTFSGHNARMDENADASQAIFEPPPENCGRDHRGGRAQLLWRTFVMTRLRWILGYMRLEIWRKIGLSGDWCLCTALRTRSGACCCWVVTTSLRFKRTETLNSDVVAYLLWQISCRILKYYSVPLNTEHNLVSV